MAVYRRSNRTRFVLLVLVLSSVTLITIGYRGGRASNALDSVRSGARDAFSPLQRATDSVLRPVGNFFEGMIHYGDLKAENARLRQENGRLQGQIVAADQATRDLASLSALDHITFVGNVARVDARVIDTTSSNFELTVEIDKGRDQGVDKDMPVISGAGLVGRVLEASRTRATVLLLEDTNFAVGVRDVASQDVAVATGQGEGHPLRVENEASTGKLATGDTLVTSGVGGSTYPGGIPVGQVATATTAAGALQQDVTVRPAVDLSRLEFVSVLQWAPKP